MPTGSATRKDQLFRRYINRRSNPRNGYHWRDPCNRCATTKIGPASLGVYTLRQNTYQYYIRIVNALMQTSKSDEAVDGWEITRDEAQKGWRALWGWWAKESFAQHRCLRGLVYARNMGHNRLHIELSKNSKNVRNSTKRWAKVIRNFLMRFPYSARYRDR